MALYLPKSDALFIHIPKCGGNFVEEVFKTYDIEYIIPEPINRSCERHSRAKDYQKADYTFCTIREFDPWMLSYWRFHMMMGHNLRTWEPNKDYPHRILGPPLTAWQFWRTNMEVSAKKYLESMQVGCDAVLSLENINTELSATLNHLGYPVTEEQVKAVPRANETKLKVELGGGTRAYKNGFSNIDIVEGCDFEWNLNDVPYPFPDCSVDEIYSSHCLEHLECPHKTLHEIARICKVGAKVLIKVPHPQSHMAMCAGHKHVFSPLQVENMNYHFPELYWKDERRLKLIDLTYAPTTWLSLAKQELPFLEGLDDQIIMRWIPNTCHESEFLFTCEVNEFT